MSPRLVPPPLPTAPSAAPGAARDAAARSRAASTPRVLLVGDAGARLGELEALLADEDADVIGATGVRTALMLLGSGEVAVAIVDMEKPDDRYRAAELLRGAERSLPLIFVTAGPHDPRAPFRGHDAGAVFFVFKPVEPGVLVKRVSALLQVHRHERLLSQRERQEREAQRAQAARPIPNPDRWMDDFLAVLSDELRAPAEPSAERRARAAGGGRTSGRR